jgi:hypothetical protein
VKNLDEIKKEAIFLYKNIGEIYSPYFQEKVSFNSKGLEHIKFKKRNHSRSEEDQIVRFKLLKYASEILKISRTIQGISKQKLFEPNKTNHRKELILVDVMFYEFVAIVDGVRIRIVIKQIENGQKFFWSIIPFWKINNKDNSRKFHYGNPEID